jgi:hypothetical protein
MKKKYPICPECGNAMVWSFAFRGCEYVCLPCDYAASMFNGLEEEERSVNYMNSKKAKWQKELSVIGRRQGGGECAICKDGSCEWCKRANDKNFEFKVWKVRLESRMK